MAGFLLDSDFEDVLPFYFMYTQTSYFSNGLQVVFLNYSSSVFFEAAPTLLLRG